MSRTEAAIRWAGAAVALVAASALMGFPAVEARTDVVLTLHAVLQLGCAAVMLSMAHGAVAVVLDASPSARAPAGLLRWLGFVGMALSVAIDVAAPARKEAVAEPEAASLDAVKGFLLFLMFLAAVWALYLSMVRGKGDPPPAAAAEEADRVELFIFYLMFLAGVLALYMSMVAMDTGRDGPPPAEEVAERVDVFILYLMFLAGVLAIYMSTGRGGPPPPPPPAAAAAAEEEDSEDGEVNVMAPRPARVVAD